jgi:hypothetical protein
MACEDSGLTVVLKRGELKRDLLRSDRWLLRSQNVFWNFPVAVLGSSLTKVTWIAENNKEEGKTKRELGSGIRRFRGRALFWPELAPRLPALAGLDEHSPYLWPRH